MNKGKKTTFTDEQVILSIGVKINIAELFEIDESNLSNEFAQQASVYAWIGKLCADAEFKLSNAKASRDSVRADLDGFYRDEMQGQKYTEAVISSKIMLDADWVDIDNACIKAEHEYRQLRQLVDAMKMRSDMLVSLGAHIRAERDMTGLHINKDGNVNKG